MLIFQSLECERRYRLYFNAHQARNDRLAHAVTIVVAMYILQRLHGTQVEWNCKALYTVVLTGERVVPAYFLWLRPDLFIQHRTLIISLLHVMHMISGDAFGAFWPPDADFSQPLQFYTMAFATFQDLPYVGYIPMNNALLLRRGLFDMTPSIWHMGLQLLHTAKGLYEAPKRIERLQPYLHRITPLKDWANRSLLMSLLHPGGLSERSLLLRIWAILRVLVGLVLPCSYVYCCQLASRRLWRRAELKRDEERRYTDGDESATKIGTGMKLLPVWKLYLPHMVLALIAATVSGHDAKLLHLMF